MRTAEYERVNALFFERFKILLRNKPCNLVVLAEKAVLNERNKQRTSSADNRFAYDPDFIVAAVPITPILPFLVFVQAAWTVGRRTPVKGIPSASFLSSPTTEETVPQAAIIILTSCFFMKAMSCAAYFKMVSRLRVP